MYLCVVASFGINAPEYVVFSSVINHLMTMPLGIEYRVLGIDPFKNFLGILQKNALRIDISHSTWVETFEYVFEMQSIPEFPGNS